MTLDEIASNLTLTSDNRVPAWTRGCYIRRCITYANGVDDTQTLVVWVQSHGMTGDLRIPAHRPWLAPGTDLAALDRDTLARLASVEGGVAPTLWDGTMMSWGDWIAYQPYDKWPEPAELRRVGNSMLEFAPSGIYVEDWRLQPSAPGVIAGLQLVSETLSSGETRARQGGLVVAGDHAILCLDRLSPPPSGAKVQDFVRKAASPLDAFVAADACKVFYLHREGGAVRIVASTDPFAAGNASSALDGFALAGDRLLTQRITGEPDIVARQWHIHSIGLGDFDLETPSTGFDWLNGEADTLLEPLKASA